MPHLDNDVVTIEGELTLWLEQGAIHLKLAGNRIDPVELTTSNARRLAGVLNKMAEQIERADNADD